MDLNLTEEQQMIQDAARRYAETALAPVAEQLDQTKDRNILTGHCREL
ncbi:acyl-CoA dehydrogenase family protein, partial [Amphritea sp.]